MPPLLSARKGIRHFSIAGHGLLRPRQSFFAVAATGAGAAIAFLSASSRAEDSSQARKRSQRNSLVRRFPLGLNSRAAVVHCAGTSDDSNSRIQVGLLALVGAGILGAVAFLRRNQEGGSSSAPDAETRLRIALTKLRDRLAKAAEDPATAITAAELLHDATAKEALKCAGLASKNERPVVAALAALAAVMTPSRANAMPPHFNEAVVVIFASLDGDGDAKLTEEEWLGLYAAARALALIGKSPPASCTNADAWHEDNARRIFADQSGPAGMDLSEFGLWCRRNLDKDQIYRWYRRR